MPLSWGMSDAPRGSGVLLSEGRPRVIIRDRGRFLGDFTPARGARRFIGFYGASRQQPGVLVRRVREQYALAGGRSSLLRAQLPLGIVHAVATHVVVYDVPDTVSSFT